MSRSTRFVFFKRNLNDLSIDANMYTKKVKNSKFLCPLVYIYTKNILIINEILVTNH